jgi:hypothetical protein
MGFDNTFTLVMLPTGLVFIKQIQMCVGTARVRTSDAAATISKVWRQGPRQPVCIVRADSDLFTRSNTESDDEVASVNT